MNASVDEQTLKNEVARLQTELSAARTKLSNGTTTISAPVPPTNPLSNLPSHPLLLLTDSALPLGSFAFSSGLESYLAHYKLTHNLPTNPNTLPHFLSLSLHSLASTTLPYLITAYNSPKRLQELDSELDACMMCIVAKRASVAQGRALLTLWDRALRSSCGISSASIALQDFSKAMKAPSSPEDDDEAEQLNAHFPLIWASTCAAMGVTLHEAAYTYLFNHAKAVVSAGVRAGVMGPYAAQGLLGSGWLREEIEDSMMREWTRAVEEAGQSVVMVDLWVGRHELLYSRIFNS